MPKFAVDLTGETVISCAECGALLEIKEATESAPERAAEIQVSPCPRCSKDSNACREGADKRGDA